MKKTFALLALLTAFLPFSMAQTPTVKAEIVLIFVDDDLAITIKDASGKPVVVKEGMTIPVGSVISTQNTTAELQLKPNKTIIKLAAKTTFAVKALKEPTGAGSNDFELAAGKIRTVAAKLTGSTVPGYNIATPTANCGVRGTDFAMKYDAVAKQDWVCVQEGQVDFTNMLTGTTLAVGQGQFANTFDAVFQAGPVAADRLAELFSDVGFVKLDPTEVPGALPPAPTSAPVAATSAPVAAPAPAPVDKAEVKSPERAAPDPTLEFLKKLVGIEVGSVNLDGKTYSKAALAPVIVLDSFKLGLYLPILYTTDLFRSQDWYRPEGNDEWSFGGDHAATSDKVSDFAQDLLLKVKFLEWGVQGADPFYLKVGNLGAMTLGHGSVVKDFANDQDFPAVRKIGLNAGLKGGPLAVEGLADDLAKTSVVGARVAIDLVSDQVALGVQSTADLRWANQLELGDGAVSALGDPILLVGGPDLQLFKINTAAFRTTAFVDVNTLAVYYRRAPSAFDIPAGFDLKPAFHDGVPGNLGGEAGFYGNLASLSYRVTFQAEKGLYTNAIFQGNYYRTRTALLESLVKYSSGTSSYRAEIDQIYRLGVHGGVGFDLGILRLEGAYRWPFEWKSGSFGPSDSDAIRLGLVVPKGKIPFVNLSGGVSYERTVFVSRWARLFDANTVVRGELVYGLVPGMDLVLGVSTATKRASNGEVIEEDGKPKVVPVVSLDTKLSF